MHCALTSPTFRACGVYCSVIGSMKTGCRQGKQSKQTKSHATAAFKSPCASAVIALHPACAPNWHLPTCCAQKRRNVCSCSQSTEACHVSNFVKQHHHRPSLCP